MAFLDDERELSKELIPKDFGCPIDDAKPLRIESSKNVKAFTIEEIMKKDKGFAKGIFLFRKIKADSSPCAAFLNANYTDCRFFFVERGKKAELSLTMDRSMAMSFIFLGEGSSLRLLSRAVSDSMNHMEIKAESGARLDSGYLKHKGACSYNAQYAIAGTCGVMNSAEFWAGSGVGRNTTELAGAGSSAHHVLLSTGGNDEKLEVNSGTMHMANGTSSSLVMKGVAEGASSTVFNGKVTVEGNGRGSKSDLSQQILLLDKEAKAEANPILEIKNNHVECSHSAAIRQLEEKKLFYLMSRGLPREMAKSSMVTGFLRSAMGTVVEKELRNLFMPPFMSD